MGEPVSLLADGIALAPFFREHVSDDYLAWINDPDVMRHTEARFRAHSRDEACAYVEASNRGSEARLWRILADGRHVGNLRLSDITYLHRRADVAIIVGERACRSKGIGSTAIRLAAGFAFSTLSLHKLTAGMYADNQASKRAFEKAGFTVDACLPEHYFCEGRWVNGLMMGLLAPAP